MPQNFWCKRITSQNQLGIIPGMTLRITSLALTESIAKKDQRTSVAIVFKANSAESPTRLCIGSLGPGRYEQSSTEINLSRGERYVLEVHGPNAVDLAGYHYGQSLHSFVITARVDKFLTDEIDEEDLPRKPTLMEDVESIAMFFDSPGALAGKGKRGRDDPEDNKGQGKRRRDDSETRENEARTTKAAPRARKKNSNTKQESPSAE